MHSRFAILAMLLCGAIAASAQVREQITVEEVDVPVYVFSRGKAVRNLTKDDFELYVNGKRQPIDYFEAVDFTEVRAAPAAAPQSAPAIGRTAQPELRDRRLFLFLFDLVFKRAPLASYAAALDRGRRAAVDMVDHALPGDFFAVAAVTFSGIKFTTPFLHDHDAIRRAILQLAPSNSHDGLGLYITPSERQLAETWSSISQPGTAGGGKLSGEDPLPDIVAAASALEQQRATLTANEQMLGYGDLAARLRGLEGLKHIIFFSDGYPFDPGEQASTVKDIVAKLQSANINFHTVDLTPMANVADPTSVSPADTSPQKRPSEDPALLGVPNVNWFAPKPGKVPPSENELLFWIANETGGSWIHWTNVLAPA
ncbi:MAG TPA: VWA domain-containing protein, partial [Thermoanaerobaculia bacterium]|nr:VWA domain-containing protein [Thermoanaerobaculia bacterium]